MKHWLAVGLVASAVLAGCRTVEVAEAPSMPRATTPVVPPEAAVLEPPPPVVGPTPDQDRLDLLAAADRAFENQDYASAVIAYGSLLEASPGGDRYHRARLRLAVLLLSGDKSPLSYRRARAYLQEIVDDESAAAFRPQAELLLDLSGRLTKLRREHTTLQQQLERLKEIDLERLRRSPG